MNNLNGPLCLPRKMSEKRVLPFIPSHDNALIRHLSLDHNNDVPLGLGNAEEYYSHWIEEESKKGVKDLHLLPDAFHEHLHKINQEHTHMESKNKPLLWSDLQKRTSWKKRYANKSSIPNPKSREDLERHLRIHHHATDYEQSYWDEDQDEHLFDSHLADHEFNYPVDPNLPAFDHKHANNNTNKRTFPIVNNLNVDKLSRHMIADHNYEQSDLDEIYWNANHGIDPGYWGDSLEKEHNSIHGYDEYMDWHKHSNKKSIYPKVKTKDISKHFSLQHLWPEDEQIQEFRNDYKDNYRNNDVHSMSSDEILQSSEFQEYLNWAHGGEHEHVHTDWLNHKHSNNIRLPFPDESNVARHLMMEHNVDKDSLYDSIMGRLDKIPDDRYDELSLMNDKTFEAQPEVQEIMHRFHDKDHQEFRGLPNPRYVKARPHTHGA